ncbi:MAG: L-ribulose-5-phosphate 4-epimerase AraD [Bacilli bacterium]|nr:L-ribulose-5-phosphate 4-epimerase AraD [Bacilli bacterium]
MLEELKKDVCKANKDLKKSGLITLTWGNASAIDRNTGFVVIKPSGVDYDDLKPEMMVVVDVKSGQIIEGSLNPSSDTPTHLELYRNFPNINGVVHTHSTFATSMAQRGNNVPCIGTTHADTFYGDIPCTRSLTKKEVETEYELNTGKVIVEEFKNYNYESAPGVLVKNHGPFTWGSSVNKAVENSIALEEICKMFVFSRCDEEMPKYLQDKHYFRKHGKNAYYGQKKGI